MTTNHLGKAAAVLATAVILAGCSRGEPTESSASIDSLAATVAEARAAGADPDQIALFDDGTITYSDYETAMNRFIKCATDAGYTVPLGGAVMRNGVTVLDYSIQAPSGTDIALADACFDQHARYVDEYWQNSSPDAIAYSERRDAALMAPLKECLAGYGEQYADDASFDELVSIAITHLTANENENCLHDIGYSSWQG